MAVQHIVAALGQRTVAEAPTPTEGSAPKATPTAAQDAPPPPTSGTTPTLADVFPGAAPFRAGRAALSTRGRVGLARSIRERVVDDLAEYLRWDCGVARARPTGDG